MSLPAETKFPCQKDEDAYIEFSWNDDEGVYTFASDCLEGVNCCMSRSQVESLRDQLTAWLSATKD